MKKLYTEKRQRGLALNLSDIFTHLIKEAAKCKRFASDVIYDIETIKRITELATNEGEDFQTETLTIAFRENGVDSDPEYVAEQKPGYYRAIYNATIEADKYGAQITLWKQTQSK